MDFQINDPGAAGFEDSFDQAAEGLADSLLHGLSSRVSEALADPIVQALMAADGVDRKSVETLLCRVAAKVADRDPPGLCHC
jgi:hypothetical protein